MLSTRHAVLWLGERHIYVFTYEKMLWQQYRYGQGSVYRRPEALAVTEVLTDVVMTYGLTGYTVTCIVSGPALQWRKLESFAANRAEATEIALWEMGLSETASIDVVPLTKPGKDTLCPWFAAAYPREQVRLFYQTLSPYVTVAAMDVLPAAISRCGITQSGTLYIPDGDGAHILTLTEGVPETYTYAETTPDVYYEARQTYGDNTLLISGLDDEFQPLEVSKTLLKKIQSLELHSMFSFMLAL